MDDSQKAEADYKAELEANGVEIPKDDSLESKEEEAPKEPEKKEPDEPKDPEPIVERKRSIYDDLKDKKHDLKEERIAREEVERERDELRQQLASIQGTNGAEDDEKDPKDAVGYAAKVGADPELVKRIIDEARANQTQIDPELKGRLDKFENWQKQNAQVIEKQMFEDEFAKTTPALQSMFPNANAEELGAIKSELDKLSHSKEMHDKELEYVAYKHKEHLSALVSPRQRGMESKGKNQMEDNSVEFNPNADLSKMTPKQMEAWEATYNGAIRAEKGVSGVGNNRRMI